MAFTFDLQSKIARAIEALLISTGVSTAKECNVFPSSDKQTFPSTEIEVEEGIPEVLGSGVFRFPVVRLIFHDEGTVQPNQPDINRPYLDAQKRISANITVLMLSDDTTTLDYTARQLTAAGNALAMVPDVTNPVQVQVAADNADMADFTILQWLEGTYGSPKRVETEGTTYWERIVTFECVACNAMIGATQIPVTVTGGIVQPTVASTGSIVYTMIDQGSGDSVDLNIVNGILAVANTGKPPFAVPGGVLTPVVDANGNTTAYKIVDQQTGQTVFLRIVNGIIQITAN